MESVKIMVAFFVGLVSIFAFGYLVDYIINRISNSKKEKRLNK